MDAVGIYICLEALIRFEKIKVAFFSDEEIGCVGSSAVDMKFFENVAFAFQPDRKGDDEVIKYSNGVDLMGEEFKSFIKPEMDLYNYKFGTGTSTDVGKLATREIGVVTMNIGCGYFEPHSLEEKVCISAVENCMNLLFRMAQKCIDENKRFTFVPEKKVYSSYASGNYSNGYRHNLYDDDYYNDYNAYGYKKDLNKKEKINEKIIKRVLTKEDLKNIQEFNNPEYWEAFKAK